MSKRAPAARQPPNPEEIVPCGRRMRVEITLLWCAKCGTYFEAETLCDIQIPVWVAHIKTIRCPKCGAGRGSRAINFVLGPDAKLRHRVPA